MQEHSPMIAQVNTPSEIFSPATEALELLNDDPNVMFDLNEMLRRDPTLSSLVKEEPGTTNNAGFAPHPQPQFGDGQARN